MANLSVNRENRNKPVTTRAQEWEPVRTLRELLRWDPFAEMMPSWAPEQANFAPAFEVKETKDGFLFKADLPGVNESDLDVRLTQNRLTISGRRESEKSEEKDTFYAYERSFGSFTRSFTLPDGVDVDGIKAELKDGVLTVQVPKCPESQPKKISVTKSEKSESAQPS
jgi:HSP20 family protein